jgi:hypothetical protein
MPRFSLRTLIVMMLLGCGIACIWGWQWAWSRIDVQLYFQDVFIEWFK